MKRSLIAVAVLLLLLSSTTFAAPPRARRTPRVRFWSSLLCWFGHNHHEGCGHYAPRHEYGRVPPGHRGRPQYGPGRHLGWENGRHNGWDRENHERGGRGPGRPGEGEHGNGRRGGRG